MGLLTPTLREPTIVLRECELLKMCTSLKLFCFFFCFFLFFLFRTRYKFATAISGNPVRIHNGGKTYFGYFSSMLSLKHMMAMVARAFH